MSRRLRILITRAAHQGAGLAERLRELGAEPILIPAIEIAPPVSFAELDAALEGIGGFDWLVFTSANAVEAFQGRAGAGRIGLAGKARIAAIGPGTARAAVAAGLVVEVVPVRAVAESLAEALLPYARREDGSAARFLLVRAEVARDVLPETLRAGGAEVTIAAAYRNVVPASSVEAIQELFGTVEDYPDAITFTSSSAVHNLFALLEAAGLELPMEIVRASIGPVTSETLRGVGFPADVEAVEASTEALAEAVVGWRRRKG
jgi:uroporphyrinogen-III synthase